MTKKEILIKLANFKLEHAEKESSNLIKELNPYAKRISVVGSIYRRHPKVKDIDLVIIPRTSFFDKIKKYNPSGGIKVINLKYKNIPVNIFLTDKKSYEATKLHFALGKAIIKMKSEAKNQGKSLTRYGLQDGNKIHTKEKKIKAILQKN